MNTRREKFCLEYAASGNATKAAEAAGYSPRTARSQGQRLLTYADIQSRIQELAAEIQGEKVSSVSDVQAFWTEIYKDGRQKTSDRLKASELLVRSQGGFMPQTNNNNDDTEEDDVLIIVPDNGRIRKETDESGVVVVVPDDGRFPKSYENKIYTEAADNE